MLIPENTSAGEVYGFLQPVSETVAMASEIDMVNRDPNNINDHIRVDFFDILAEPDGIKSFDCIWKCSYRCFECWKHIVYVILTTLFGICIAAEWGCEFAYIAFYHIWYITPIMKVLEIECGCMKKFYGICVHCCLDPLCESFGLLFSAFKR